LEFPLAKIACPVTIEVVEYHAAKRSSPGWNQDVAEVHRRRRTDHDRASTELAVVDV